jgi:hypothetical protein
MSQTQLKKGLFFVKSGVFSKNCEKVQKVSEIQLKKKAFFFKTGKKYKKRVFFSDDLIHPPN